MRVVQFRERVLFDTEQLRTEELDMGDTLNWVIGREIDCIKRCGLGRQQIAEIEAGGIKVEADYCHWVAKGVAQIVGNKLEDARGAADESVDAAVKAVAIGHQAESLNCPAHESPDLTLGEVPTVPAGDVVCEIQAALPPERQHAFWGDVLGILK